MAESNPRLTVISARIRVSSSAMTSVGTPLRWSGAGVLALAVVWAVSAPRPDGPISADGRNVAVRGADGKLHLSCDKAGCATQTADGAFMALSLRPDAIADDCERAALIVTARQVPSGCRASVIDAERLRRQGALTLRRTSEGFAVEAVKPRGIDRPWSPSAGGDSTDAETTLPVSRPARTAVDATPSEVDLQADE